jgi:hypothetical protein
MLQALDDAMAARDAAVGRLKQPFKASDVANLINGNSADANALIVRGFLYPQQQPGMQFTPKSVGKRLKAHTDEPVRHCRRVIALKSLLDKHEEVMKFYVLAVE